MTPLAKVLTDTVLSTLGWPFPEGHPNYDRIRSELGRKLKETLKYQQHHSWKDNIPCEELLRIYEIHSSWWAGFIPRTGRLHKLAARYFTWKARRKRQRCMRILELIADDDN